MTPETPIWRCAYIDNQMHLEDDAAVMKQDKGSIMTKPMEVANGLTVFVHIGVDRE